MLRMPSRCRILSVLLVLLTACTLPTQAAAQAGSKPPGSAGKSKSSRKTKTTKAANIKTGTLVSLDADNLKIQIKTDAGETLAYHLAEKTRYFKTRQEAQADAFKVGDKVIVKLRKVRNKPAYSVFELTDTESYDWLTGLRKNTVAAIIKEIADDTMTVTVENNPVVYTVSEKTRWNRKGKDVSSGSFKAGETVVVVPRSLPSGNIMARVVADNAQDAELAKEESSGLISGTFKSLDKQTHTITLMLEGAETRTVPYNETTEVRLRTKKTTLSALKSGQHIVVHLQKEEENATEIASRITIEANSPRPSK